MKNNILFLLVDQWPYKCFGFMGDNINTPTIDNLAKEGTVFTNAFTTCPLCSPARGALFTSRWHHKTGMIDNVAVGYSLQKPLNIKEKTWLDTAIENGYHVGYYGKWHLGANGPIERGVHGHPLSIEINQLNHNVSNYNYTKCKKNYENEGKSLIEGKVPFYGKDNKSLEETNPYIVVNEAKEFIDDYVNSNNNKPFLLTVSISDPHFPHYLPKEFVNKIDKFDVTLPKNIKDKFIDKPWFHGKPWWPSMETSNLSEDDWKEVIRYAYIHRMLVDKALGEVIEKLKENSLYENTTIIFTSDHGDMCGAHNRFDKGPYFYDEVFRIPLIIKSQDAEKKREEAFTSILDVGTTMFDLLGNIEDINSDGYSLLPILQNKVNEDKWKKEVYGMYDSYNGMSFKIRAIRTKKYKYIYNPQAIDEFYDLTNDPYEMNNLINEDNYKIEKQKLKTKLFNWMEQEQDPLIEEKSLPEAGMILYLDKPGP